MIAPPFPDARLVERYIKRRQETSLSEADLDGHSGVVFEPDELRAAQEGYGGIGWRLGVVMIDATARLVR